MAKRRDEVRRRRHRWLYEDDTLRMGPDHLIIRRYYWPFGRKRVAYDDIVGFTVRILKAWHGQHRVHGIDRRGRWYSRDSYRGEKELAIDLDVGGVIRPVLTPSDPDAVSEILRGRTDGASSQLDEAADAGPGAETPEAWLL